jgi:hypothetical protein
MADALETNTVRQVLPSSIHFHLFFLRTDTQTIASRRKSNDRQRV